MSKTFDLHDRVVVITGGARGIGLATAQACAARGARVVIGDLDLDLARRGAQDLHGLGLALDVRDPASFTALIEAANARFGTVDVLINNAGIMPTGDFLTESPALSDAQIDVNLRGVIHGTRAVLGCKRVLMSNDYYPALTQPNVDLIASGVRAVEGKP